MKNTYSQKLGLSFMAVALFLASCGSNATFSKRYHNRGFNIAWGGGSDATPSKPVARKSASTAEKQSVSVTPNISEATPMVESATFVNANIPDVNTKIANSTSTQALTNSQVVAKANHGQIEALSAVKVLAAAKSTKQQVLKASQPSQKKKSSDDPGNGKSQVIALILCLVVGVVGIHRFYLGYTMEGVLQLVTAGGCGIWTLIDLVRIITGDLKPKNGDYTETL